MVCVSAGVAEDLARYAPIPAAKLSVIHNPVLYEELLRSGGSAPTPGWRLISRPLSWAPGA